MEEEIDAEKIRQIESQFIKSIEFTIDNTYIPHLFNKYRQATFEINNCFKNRDLNLEDAKKCANTTISGYQNKEKQFESLLLHHEQSIHGCIKLCKYDFKNPILPCYEKCFSNIIKSLS